MSFTGSGFRLELSGSCLYTREVTTVITQHPLSMTPEQRWFIKQFLNMLLNNLYFQLLTRSEICCAIESRKMVEICEG